MARIQPIDLNTTDPGIRHTLGAIKVKLGILPNLFTTLAHSPAALNGYIGLSESLTVGGRLSARQRELIAIAVAQRNRCGYCLSAHAAIGKGLGLSEEAVLMARHGSAADPADAAVVAFALALVESHGAVPDDRLAALRAQFDDGGIAIEIVAQVALNVLTNYVNRLAETELDFPELPLASAS